MYFISCMKLILVHSSDGALACLDIGLFRHRRKHYCLVLTAGHGCHSRQWIPVAENVQRDF
ncbi:hypothetical protein HanPI659440_Chr09g0320121 [Helianthus annuus]|nr:hypothetical protein HanPI659440_Chr09g0320121 [Helianthus annuus]